MEYGAVIVSGRDVGKEVLRGFRRFPRVQFNADDAVIGVKLDHCNILFL
jgi:hypothetical protein